MKFREHDLNTCKARLRFDINRNSSPVVGNGNGAIFELLNLNGVAMASEGLVNRVIDDLPKAMHQATAVC